MKSSKETKSLTFLEGFRSQPRYNLGTLVGNAGPKICFNSLPQGSLL